MKKIVGILAAAAIATSVFAADVSAGAKVASTLFNSKDGAISLLGTLNNDLTANYKTLFSLQFSSDNAGGGVKYWGAKASSIDLDKVMTPDEGKEPKDAISTKDFVAFDSFNVWFKPTDALKLSFRENGLELFGDKYNGYYAHNVAGATGGYGLTYAADALTLDLRLGENFVSKAKDADAVVGALGAKLSYSADFGSVAAVFEASNTFKNFKVGAGYSGSFDAVSVVFNAGAVLEDGKDAVIGINPSAGGSIDAISWAIDVPVEIAAKAKVGLNTKAAYALDACTATAYFEDGNLLADKFDAKIGLKFNGSVGAASWTVDPSFKVADKEFNVAFETAVNF
jgi:hypothetical protein